MLNQTVKLDAIRAALEPRLSELGARFDRFTCTEAAAPRSTQTAPMASAIKAIGKPAVILKAHFEGWSHEYALASFTCETALDPSWDTATSIQAAMKLFEIELRRQATNHRNAREVGVTSPIPRNNRGRIDHLRTDRDSLAALSRELGSMVDAVRWLSGRMAALHDWYEWPFAARGRPPIEIGKATITPTLVISPGGGISMDHSSSGSRMIWCGSRLAIPDRLPGLIVEGLSGRALGEVVGGLPFGHRIISSATTYEPDYHPWLGTGFVLEMDEIALAEVLDEIPPIAGTRAADR